MKTTHDAATLAAIAKAVGMAASKDAIKLHLNAVQVTTNGDGVTLTATDGFRCHTATAPAADGVEQFPGGLLVSAREFSAAMKDAAKIAKTAQRAAVGRVASLVEMSHDGNALRVSVVSNGYDVATFHVPTLCVEFPPVAQLFDGSTECETGAHFHAGFMSDAFAAAACIDDVVTVKAVRVGKPARIVSDSATTGATFAALLMPQRGRA